MSEIATAQQVEIPADRVQFIGGRGENAAESKPDDNPGW